MFGWQAGARLTEKSVGMVCCSVQLSLMSAPSACPTISVRIDGKITQSSECNQFLYQNITIFISQPSQHQTQDAFTNQAGQRKLYAILADHTVYNHSRSQCIQLQQITMYTFIADHNVCNYSRSQCIQLYKIKSYSSGRSHFFTILPDHTAYTSAD